MSPEVARTGHGAMSALSLLSGVKRKSGLRAVRSVVDPERTLTLLKRKDALPVVLHADHRPAFFLCFIVEPLREGAELAVGQTRCRAISVLSRSVVMQHQHFQPRSSASGGPLPHLLGTHRVSQPGLRLSGNPPVESLRLPIP